MIFVKTLHPVIPAEPKREPESSFKLIKNQDQKQNSHGGATTRREIKSFLSADFADGADYKP